MFFLEPMFSPRLQSPTSRHLTVKINYFNEPHFIMVEFKRKKQTRLTVFMLTTVNVQQGFVEKK